MKLHLCPTFKIKRMQENKKLEEEIIDSGAQGKLITDGENVSMSLGIQNLISHLPTDEYRVCANRATPCKKIKYIRQREQ